MNVYRRYFRVTTGPLIVEINKCQAINHNANSQYAEILKEIGAKSTYYQHDSRLSSILFESSPDMNVYKKTKEGYYPKQNNKSGRELHKRFKAIKTMSEEDCLISVGLSGRPSLFGGNRCYMPTLCIIPSASPVGLVVVPWYDEDPKVLAEYVKDRERGKKHDGNLETILWTPSEDMIEVKEWETKKEISEWNDAIKEK